MIESPAHRLVTTAIAALGALLICGCGPQESDIQQLNQNEFTLRSMIASDKQRIDALTLDNRRLSDRVDQMQRAQNEAGSSESSGGLGDRVSKLETEVASLNAGLVASPTAAPPATPGAGAPPAPGAPVAAAPPEAPTPEIPPSWPTDLDKELEDAGNSNAPGIKMYRAGLNAMKDGKYPAAVADFTRLQHQYPKSDLSEPAEYFAANALFEVGKFEEAVLQFNDMVKRYPKGRFSAPALIRQAQAFMKLNDMIDARLTLKMCMNDHAGTPEATQAATLLKQIGVD